MANVSSLPPPCTQGGMRHFECCAGKKYIKAANIRADVVVESQGFPSVLCLLALLSVPKRGSSEPCCTMSHLAGEPKAPNINLLLKEDL